MPKLFEFYKNFMKKATRQYVLYILESLALISQNVEGRQNVLKNQTILQILVLSIQREDVDVANTSAKILMFVLKNSTRKDVFGGGSE